MIDDTCGPPDAGRLAPLYIIEAACFDRHFPFSQDASIIHGCNKRQTSRLCLPEDILSQAEAGGWLIFGQGKTETG